MNALRKVRELFTFTKNEQRIFFFLSIVFIAGAGIKLWRAAAEEDGPSPPAFDYRRSDSVFAARSASPLPTSPVVTKQAPASKIDLNTAPKAELMRLPGIGDTMASRIIAYRSGRVGGFGSEDELTRVRGIGAKTLERLRPFIVVNRARKTR